MKIKIKSTVLKSIISIFIVLLLLLSVSIPAFAQASLSEHKACLSESVYDIREDEPGLLPRDETAGEVMLGVSIEGSNGLRARLAETDIVFNTLMDASNADLSSDDINEQINTSVKNDGCLILLAQSRVFSDDELITLLSGCYGVYYVEKNPAINLSDVISSDSAVSGERIPDEKPQSTDKEEFISDSVEDNSAIKLSDVLPSDSDTAEYNASEEKQQSTDKEDGILDSVEENNNVFTENNENQDVSLPTVFEPIYSDLVYNKSDKALDGSYLSYQWALHNNGSVNNGLAGVDINIGDAKGSKDVAIVVMDTGIDHNHPDLKDRMIDLREYGSIMEDTGCGQYGYDATDFYDHTDTMDYDCHGTACAGLVGGMGTDFSCKEIGIRGVMDDVTLVSARISKDGSIGYESNVIDAINWVVEAKQYYGVNIAAVNISFNLYNTTSMKIALSNMDAAGITAIKASGNDNSELITDDSYIVRTADSTIVVNAMDATGIKSSYSNYGMITDLFAPANMTATTRLSTNTEWTSDFGEKDGNSLVYSGFDDPSADTLKFSADKSDMAVITDENSFAGGQCLKISGEQGNVSLVSSPVNLSGRVDSEDVWFGYRDYADGKHALTFVSVKVKDASTGESRWEPFIVFAEVEKNSQNESMLWNSYSVKDGQVVEQLASELSENNTVSLRTVYSSAKILKSMNLITWEDEYGNNSQGDAVWRIDWESFQIKLETKSIDNTVTDGIVTDEPWSEPIYIDNIGFGTSSQSPLYTFFDGTSAAAPVVTGVYGLVYAEYGKADGSDAEYECNDKLSARIIGSANIRKNAPDISAYCSSGGMVDVQAALSADETSFNPVLQSSSVNMDLLTMNGWFLGEQGTVTIDGTPADIISYSQDKNEKIDTEENAGTIVVRIPDGLTGYKVVEYTNASGKSGRIYADVTTEQTDYTPLSLPDDSVLNLCNSVNLIETPQGPAMYCEVDKYFADNDILMMYDKDSDTWEEIAEIPAISNSQNIIVVYYHNCFYALCMLADDWGWPVYGQQLYRLVLKDAGKGEWVPVGNIMDNLMLSRLAVCGDRLIIAGGIYLDTFEHYEGIAELTVSGDNMSMTELFTVPGMILEFNSRTAYSCGYLWAVNTSDEMENEMWKIDIENYNAERVDLPVEGTMCDPPSFSIASTPSGLIYNCVLNNQQVYTDTWFYDVSAGQLIPSDLVLDNKLISIVDEVTVGNTTYVLGMAGNKDQWFFRSLCYETEGPEVNWNKNSDSDARFSIGISTVYLSGSPVTLDGSPLAAGKDYTINTQSDILTANEAVQSDETIVTLKADYLETLSVGSHKINVPFRINGRDMIVVCNLNVKEAEKKDDPKKDDPKKYDPKKDGEKDMGTVIDTGDNFDIELYALVALISSGILIGIIILMYIRRRVR